MPRLAWLLGKLCAACLGQAVRERARCGAVTSPHGLHQTHPGHTLQFAMYQSSSPEVAECEGLPPCALEAASAGEFLTGE